MEVSGKVFGLCILVSGELYDALCAGFVSMLKQPSKQAPLYSLLNMVT